MKTLKFFLAVCAIVMLTIGFSSCGDGSFPTTTTKWLVLEIDQNKNSNETSLYLVRPLDVKNLNASSTWFVDSIGKFNVGDTLTFQLSSPRYGECPKNKTSE